MGPFSRRLAKIAIYSLLPAAGLIELGWSWHHVRHQPTMSAGPAYRPPQQDALAIAAQESTSTRPTTRQIFEQLLRNEDLNPGPLSAPTVRPTADPQR